MKPKTVIVMMLLLFVLASVVYLVVGELRSTEKEAGPAEPNLPTVAESEGHSLGTDVQDESQIQTSEKVVLYYFHGTARCPTCKKFETFADEALREAFAESLDEGRLEWKAINVDEQGNAHFVKDYQLYSKSLVVVKFQDGRQTAWKNLEKIWKLVRDKETFVKYIQDEVRTYLEAG